MRVDNDAKTYALAEYQRGAGKGTRSVLVVTIGTGIGRAYGEQGKILNIERFGQAETWEKEYQKIRGTDVDARLAKYLARKINPIIKRYGPEAVVFGGGVTEREGFFQKLNRELKSLGSKVNIQKSKLGNNAGAIGAALLWD